MNAISGYKADMNVNGNEIISLAEKESIANTVRKYQVKKYRCFFYGTRETFKYKSTNHTNMLPLNKKKNFNIL